MGFGGVKARRTRYADAVRDTMQMERGSPIISGRVQQFATYVGDSDLGRVVIPFADGHTRIASAHRAAFRWVHAAVHGAAAVYAIPEVHLRLRASLLFQGGREYPREPSWRI